MAKALKAFEKLLRRIVKVPKEQVDAEIEKRRGANVERRESINNPPKK